MTDGENDDDDLLDTNLLQTESVNSDQRVIVDQDNPTSSVNPQGNSPRRSQRSASKQHHRDTMD